MASSSGMRASSSRAIKTCSNEFCGRIITLSGPGWKSGDREVDLCYQCFIAFSNNQFCSVYHKTLKGWKTCRSCQKGFHCGCVASSYDEINSEFECRDCVAQHANLNQKSDSVETNDDTTITPSPRANGGIIITPTPRINDDTITPNLRSNGATTIPPAPRVNINGVPHRYAPRMTHLQLEEIKRGCFGENSQVVIGFGEEEIQDHPQERNKVKLVPLFEKVLTATDTGKSRCLGLPKICAEKFFPSINDQESKKVVCQDTEGEDWKFTFRSLPKNKGRMYVLDEFDLYAEAMELSLGDTVTFSRLHPERKLIIGYRKNLSASLCNHLPRAAITSTSRVRDTRGIVKFYNVNGEKGQNKSAMPSMVSHGDANESPNFEADIRSSRVPVGARKKSGVVGSTSNSSRKKQKITEVDSTNEAQEPLSSDHGGNGLFMAVAERVKIKSQKGMAIDSTRVPPFMVPLEPPVRAKGKQIKIGSTSRRTDKKRKISSAFDPTLMESMELDWSPRAPRGSKGKAVVGSSTPGRKNVLSKAKSVAKTIKNITQRIKNISQRAIASSKRTKLRNHEPEPEPQATAEARDAPERSKVSKKHPHHRPGCKCIVCIQPPSGSNHPSTCTCRACLIQRDRIKTMKEKARKKQPTRRRRKVPAPPKPSKQQISRLSRGSEENHVERKEPSPSHSAEPHSNNNIRPIFDLNLPASANDDDDNVDPTRQYTNGYGGYLSE